MPDPSAGHAPSGEGRTVLLIDDEHSVRLSFKHFLEDYGYEVLEARDGTEGLEVFKERRPDLVVTDLRMPGIDGLGVLPAIKDISPDTPIIVVSGTGKVKDVVAAVRLGAWDYLTKPVEDLQNLHDSLDQCIRRAREKKESKERSERLAIQVARSTEELEKATAQLSHAQRLESVGRLAGGIAHDFNNLLSPILAYAELLLMDFSPKDRRRDDLLEIQKAANRAKDLTRQLLAFSRKQVLEMKTVNLSKVVSGFEKILRRTIREDIELVFDLSMDISAIEADVSQLEQILMNLAVNAQDALPSGGRILLEVKEADFMPEDQAHSGEGGKSGKWVLFKISDDGVGMDSHVLSRLFEPFFTTKEQGKGTGLGLATVHGIVKQHGGSIRVDSRPDEGASFSLYFPCVDRDPESFPAASDMETVSVGEEQILVVEDDPAVRELVSGILKKYGYSPLTAASPKEALELADAHDGEIAMVLTDVIMPGMSGPELFEKINVLRPGIKVLYMSGYSFDVIEAQGGLDGGSEMVQKPISVMTLTKKVREILDRD